MNGLHYQKAIDAPQPAPLPERPPPHGRGADPDPQPVTGWPLLHYDYRLPVGMTSLPLDNPCLRYEFELHHLGRLGQLALHWQGRRARENN